MNREEEFRNEGGSEYYEYENDQVDVFQHELEDEEYYNINCDLEDEKTRCFGLL